MVHKVLLWSGFGVAVRLWQLGIEMRPLFDRRNLWVYPLFGGIGGSFGYWLMGVEQRQQAFLQEKRDSLMAKRKRKAEREAAARATEEGEDKGIAQVVEETVASARSS